MKANAISVTAALVLLAQYATGQSIPESPRVDDRQVVHLEDSPAVEFSTSGWAYTNSANPFLLTPDDLTNAMVGVSRLRKGQSFLKDGPVVPEQLDLAAIEKVLSERLKGKEDLEITSGSMDKREMVFARYKQGERRALEIAFALKEHLVHVLVLAKEGRYHERAERVAINVAKTMKAK
jgi:hypothetical protein